MLKSGQNKLKANRLANRKCQSLRFSVNPFIISDKEISNRLYIVHSQGLQTRHEIQGNS
jgi:hypothetical protein